MSSGPEATQGRFQPPVDPDRDHVLGPEDAPVTLVEYGDFQCPACGDAHEVIREALESLQAHVRFVFRHFPIDHSHPQARLAAEAVEAAGAQGRFWEMHDHLLQHRHPERLERSELVAAAGELGLDVDRFERELEEGTHADRVDEDLDSGVRSGVNGTPTFFIDGVRYDGTWERGELKRALEVAAIDARLNAPGAPSRTGRPHRR